MPALESYPPEAMLRQRGLWGPVRAPEDRNAERSAFRPSAGGAARRTRFAPEAECGTFRVADVRPQRPRAERSDAERRDGSGLAGLVLRPAR